MLGTVTGCLALLAAAAPLAAAADPPAGPAAWMFDPDTVIEIELGGLSQAEIDELEADPDEYQPGTFEVKIGGVTQGPVLDEIGIRLKGGLGSFRPLTEKAAFKIKFDEYVDDLTFFGLEKLTLNNMVQDASMLHETLTYELSRALDVAAPRTGYAFIRLNGEDFGLHLNVETLDVISLPRWFDSTQHLYEADAPGLDLEPGNAEDFEVDEGDDEDISDLEALIAAANDDVGDWSDGMAAVADLEQMTRMWAVERYAGHWDGYAGEEDPFRPNNYYVHSDAAGVFSMLPWGTDQTWVKDVEFDEEAGGLLFNECLADTSCNALYVDALESLQSTTPTLGLRSRAAELAAMLAPWQERDPRLEFEFPDALAEIEEAVEVVCDFIAERRVELADWLGTSAGPLDEDPCPLPPPDPDPDPEDKSEPTASASQQPAPAPKARGRLRIGPSRVVGAFVSTRLEVPAGGRATQRAMAKVKGRWRTACTGQAARAQAGSLTVRCRLSAAALRRLGNGPLRLKVRVGFVPKEGPASSKTRQLTVPKRG